MKRLIASLAAVLFLAVVSGSAFAAETVPAKTPTAKTMKHKGAHKKKKKKAMNPSSTPTVKK
jgi:hypothetical protein